MERKFIPQAPAISKYPVIGDEFLAALREVKREFAIPTELPLHSGGGVTRVLVSAALGASNLAGLVLMLEKNGKIAPEDFAVRPIGKRCLLASLIAERPLSGRGRDSRQIEVAFIQRWKAAGLTIAMEEAPRNPIFCAGIRDLVTVAVEYVSAYHLVELEEVLPRYFDHFKPLRYVLHSNR